MKKNRLVKICILCSLIIVASICSLLCLRKSKLLHKDITNNDISTPEKTDYSINKKSYTINRSYVEYPQIIGLKDKKKQDHINELLKDKALNGALLYTGEPFVDLNNSDKEYTFEYITGISNNNMISFWYYIYVYIESINENGFKDIYDGERYIDITIDMTTGEEITLSNLMVVDERLINSTDGTGRITDYDSAVNLVFYNVKDAFEVYCTEEERDNFHSRKPQDVIERLTNTKKETCWYIDIDKNIVYFESGCVHLPYTQLSDVIYPKYYEILASE